MVCCLLAQGVSALTMGDFAAFSAGDFTIANNATVNGGTASSQSTFLGVAMGDSTDFSAGGANIVNDEKNKGFFMYPASYGALNLGNRNSVFLRSGDYYFTEVDVGRNCQLYLDLSTGTPLNVFVEGDASFGDGMDVWVKTPTSGGYADVDNLSNADRDLASLVYMETHGSWGLQFGGDWFGAVYAPNDLSGTGVSAGADTQLWGALYSGGELVLREGSTLNYIQSYRFDAPEPELN